MTVSVPSAFDAKASAAAASYPVPSTPVPIGTSLSDDVQGLTGLPNEFTATSVFFPFLSTTAS